MTRNWKQTAEQLQKLLLVRKVIISPLLGEQLEAEDEASESTESRRTETPTENSQIHKAQRKE